MPHAAGWRKLARVAEEASTPDIDYRALLHDALLDVVRKALSSAAENGLPGEHHFYLAFRTDAAGVELAPRLAREHPQEMTIVLQHQYWNLQVDDQALSVTLKFGGSPERLVIPFSALTSFVDPSVPFGLRLQALAEEAASDAQAQPEEPPLDAAAASNSPAAREAGTVLDFAAFRRRE